MTILLPLILSLNYLAKRKSRSLSVYNNEFKLRSVLSFPLTLTLQLLRAKAECFARLCHRLGVCLSVRLSHS